MDGVLNNLEKAGATAVATSPYLMEPASEQDGSREPPDDAGAGKVRMLNRPLWGKRDLWVRTAPSFEPSKTLYRRLRYQPPSPSSLTRKQGHLLHEFIEKARARNLRVYLQMQAAIPPGYRVQFRGPQGDDRPAYRTALYPPEVWPITEVLPARISRTISRPLFETSARTIPK